MPRLIGDPAPQKIIGAKVPQQPTVEVDEELLLQLEEENRIDDLAADTAVESSKTDKVKGTAKARDRYDLKGSLAKTGALDGAPSRLFRRPTASDTDSELNDEEKATLNYTLAVQQGLLDRDSVGPVFGGIVGGEGPIAAWASSFDRLVEAQRLYRLEDRAGKGFPETRKVLDAFIAQADAVLQAEVEEAQETDLATTDTLTALDEAQLRLGMAIAYNALGLTWVTPAEQSWQRALEQFDRALTQVLRLEAITAMDGAPDALVGLRAQAQLWREMIEGNRARCLPVEAAIEVLWERLAFQIEQAREDQKHDAELQRRRAEDRKADELKAYYIQAWIRADQLAKRILGADGNPPLGKRTWESLSDEERGRLGAAMAHAREAFAAYGRRFRDVNGRFPAFYELQGLDGVARGDPAAIRAAVEAARAFDSSKLPEGSRERAQAWANSVVARFSPFIEARQS